jgi:hypothetical protein
MVFRRSRTAVLITLATFVLALGLPLVSSTHGLGDDADAGWIGAPGVPDAGARLTSSTDDATGDTHCAVCHWARALGATTVAHAAAPVAPPSVSLTADAFATRPSAPFSSARSPRGPPPALA